MFMKQILEHLEKEINDAIKLRDLLSKKYFYKEKATFDNIKFIEFKISKDEFLSQNGKFSFNEYSIGNKTEKFLNVLKIKNHKLKEYYEVIMPFIIKNDYAPSFNGNLKQCFDLINQIVNKNNILSGFKINNNFFTCCYISVNTNNEIDDFYFRCNNPIICDFGEFFGEKCLITIRFNAKTFKINKIYITIVDFPLFTKKYNSKILWLNYYYNLENLSKYEFVGVAIDPNF